VVSDTAEARKRYYEALGEAEPLSYEQRLGNLQAQSEYYKGLSTSLPSESPSGYEYGEGGPAAAAALSLAAIEKQIAELTPMGAATEVGAYQSRRRTLLQGGDPTLSALTQLKGTARSQYNRLPNISVSRRLAPSVRFR